MNYFTGKHLHSLLIQKGHSLHGSAKALGISTDEMESYFTYEKFEKEHLSKIFEALNLGTINNTDIVSDAKVEYLKSLAFDLINVIEALANYNAALDKMTGIKEKLPDVELLYSETRIKSLLEATKKRLNEI